MEKNFLNDLLKKELIVEQDDFTDVWDYVSQVTISDDWWFENIQAMKEITHELYLLDAKSINSNLEDPYIRIKLQGKMLEVIFTTLRRYNLLK
jgi:hypothetical protein